MPDAQFVARVLSFMQREFLIANIDCVRPVTHGGSEDATRNSLIARGLIRYDSPAPWARPKGTVLTDHGKATVCAVLNRYAEALLAVGSLDEEKLEEIYLNNHTIMLPTVDHDREQQPEKPQ